jgi:putative transposase
VHWTLTLENRARGWLTGSFHQDWKLLLLHTCARYSLVCPVYVLMPDHCHLVFIGVDDCGADQRVAIEFLRKRTAPLLAPARWQQQSHDNVIREQDRERNAFTTIAHYVFDNPVRSGLVTHWMEYKYSGYSIPGYPDLPFHSERYWVLFWRIFERLVTLAKSTRSRS